MAKKGSTRSSLLAWSVSRESRSLILPFTKKIGSGISTQFCPKGAKVQMPGKGILNFELIDTLKTVNKDLPSLID